jgi:23S rRNA (pseudouridine1915-N3)-methyltransferase
MRVEIRAVGRMKAGPERELADRYVDRAEKAGRALALGPFAVRETPESRAPRAEARMAEEAGALLSDLAGDAFVIVLDERGETPTSERFANMLLEQRDRGRPLAAFLIGGADGHGAAALARADLRIAFGAMTWPHQIVRILVAEQLYRAVTILSGHPYHRA